MLRLRLRMRFLCVVVVVVGSSYSVHSMVCPLDSSWSKYSLAWLSNVALFFESRLILCTTMSGMAFTMLGGWLDCLLTYLSLLPGFRNGWKVLRLRSRNTSQNSVRASPESIVIPKPIFSMIVRVSFSTLFKSQCESITARPSSRYNP